MYQYISIQHSLCSRLLRHTSPSPEFSLRAYGVCSIINRYTPSQLFFRNLQSNFNQKAGVAPMLPPEVVGSVWPKLIGVRELIMNCLLGIGIEAPFCDLIERGNLDSGQSKRGWPSITVKVLRWLAGPRDGRRGPGALYVTCWSNLILEIDSPSHSLLLKGDQGHTTPALVEEVDVDLSRAG